MQTRVFRSTVTADAKLRLSIEDVDLEPGADDVIVRVDAAPINPTDIFLMLSMADVDKAVSKDGVLEAPLAPALVQAFAARVDKPLAIGTEGAGTIVAAGASPAAQALLGKVVAAHAGGMFASHRKVPAAAVQPLPAGKTAEDGASAFVNPMTALSFVETMRAEGHTAIVHTAAASNLGQMLVRICAADGVPLVNIVRRAEHVAQLQALGAKYVLDSSTPAFKQDLAAAVAETGATLAFDAIGGGTLGSTILDAMERAEARKLKAYSHYGSSTLKQLYIYGGLDRAPTQLVRTFGMTWSAGGYLVMNALKKLGAEAIGRMTARVMSELTTTFASAYSRRITLDGLVDADTVRAFARMSTGEKFVITA
jgi:NADPH:quinone reductase